MPRLSDLQGCLEYKMKGYPKCVTLYPGYYIYVCPCGFPAVLMQVDRKGSRFGIKCWKCKETKGKYHKVEINRELDFSANWNNKLNCQSFTTIRLLNRMKYCIGNRFEIRLRGTHKGYARIIDLRVILLNQVNEFVARLDTGYSALECQEIIKTMYRKQKYIDWNTQELAFCLLMYEGKKEQMLFEYGK